MSAVSGCFRPDVEPRPTPQKGLCVEYVERSFFGCKIGSNIYVFLYLCIIVIIKHSIDTRSDFGCVAKVWPWCYQRLHMAPRFFSMMSYRYVPWPPPRSRSTFPAQQNAKLFFTNKQNNNNNHFTPRLSVMVLFGSLQQSNMVLIIFQQRLVKSNLKLSTK